MITIVPETRSFPLPAPEAENLFHLHQYCRRMNGMYALAMVNLEKSVHYIKSKAGPTVVGYGALGGVRVPNLTCVLE